MEPVCMPVPPPNAEVGDGAGKLHIILVEDDDGDAALIVAELTSAGIETEVCRATNEAELRARLKSPNIDALLCDYSLPGLDALRALEVRSECGVIAPLIVVSGGLSDERAAECMRLGASDYVLKDRLGRLPHALLQAVEHSRSEFAAREIERSYRRLFDNVPLAVFRDTAEGRLLQANAAAVAMFGFSDLEGLLKRSVLGLYTDPADRATLLARLGAEGHVLGFECRMRRADGSEFWVSRAVHAVRREDGRVVEMESIGWDTTERREAVRRVSDSEAYLSTVVETAPDAVVRVDETGTITDWNSEAERTFGWSRSEIIGRRLSETIIPAGLRAQHQRGMARFKADGTTTMIGHRWDNFSAIRKGGENFPIELAISPPIPLGTANQFVGFIRDITQRRLAELELAKSEERMRSLLTGAPVAILTMDLEGRFTFAGGSVFADLQIDAESLVGMKATDAFPDRPDFATLLVGAVKEDVRADLEFGGRTFHVRSGPFRLSPDGPVIGVRTVAFDTTERVEAEERLSRRAAQETVLLGLSQAGLEGRETADFLMTAVELVAGGAGTQFGTILELRPDEDRFIRVAAYGHRDGIPQEAAPLAMSSHVIDALKSETPVVAFDYPAQPEVQRSPWMIEEGVVASMAVGIGGPQRPFGVLSVHSSEPREFTAEDLHFMHLATTIISVAIERKRAEQQRRRLLSRLVTAQEAERKIIAEDIHDDAVQVMTAANMRLELFRMALTDPVQVEAAEKLQEVVALATGRLRNLLFELSPGAVDRHGLAAAVRMQLEQFQIDTGVHWHLDNELSEEPAPEARILVYRIFQEALANVRKHARAHNVNVSLASVEGGVQMRLVDDGLGFGHPASVEHVLGHLGLASMRERAENAGGWWRLASEPGRGTDLSTWVPSHPEADATVPADAMALG